MPSLINRVPPGLLSLLGIKALGQNPNILLDEVQPTFPLQDLYLGAITQSEGSQTGPITAVGIWRVGISAGPGEVVACTSVCAQMNGGAAISAGAVVSFVPVVVYDAGAIVRAVSVVGTRASGIAGDFPASGSNQLFFIPPNHTLGVLVDDFTLGAGVAIEVWARTVRVAV